MKKCKAILKNDTRCSKTKLRMSRYCWWHQDYTMIVGIVGILATIFVTFIIFAIQERQPSLDIKCDVLENGDPCILKCIINNSGRREAKDVFVSFNKMLPLQTKVFANPELGITIHESEVLPNPHLYPELSQIQKAFAVKIPRIAPKDVVTFQVRTIHPDNKRAGEQIIRIRKEILKVLDDFDKRLSDIYLDEATKWDKDSVINARIKEENLFLPVKLSYEKGRINIEYFTEKEKIAKAINQDLYSRIKKEVIDIYQGRPEFKAPVIRIKLSDGEGTVALFPPYIKTYLDVSVSMEELKRKGKKIIYPQVPETY